MLDLGNTSYLNRETLPKVSSDLENSPHGLLFPCLLVVLEHAASGLLDMLSTPHHTLVSPAHTAVKLTQESQGSALIKAVCPTAFAGHWAWHCGVPSAAQFLFRTPHLFRSLCARLCNRSQDRFLGLESILIPASLFASFSLHKTKAGACLRP